jgi:DNA (cytosine-5)-methyltransferase 1
MKPRKTNSPTRPPEDNRPPAPTFIDLFCGCGGFSLGMMRAGFRCVAALDADASAVETYRKNLAEFSHPGIAPASNVLKCDLRNFAPEDLAAAIGMDHVDVIVGGPPCQGFSLARKVGGANHGRRLQPDARRHLFQDFLRFVGFFRPKVFVMENVLGLRSAAGGEYFTAVQRAARSLSASGFRYRVHAQVEDARLLGVPQKRQRQLIVGVRMDISPYIRHAVRPSPHATPNLPLGPAIGDLPPLPADSGGHSRPYSLPLRKRHLSFYGDVAKRFLENVLEVGLAPSLTSHVARYHSPRDLRDFSRLKEGESSEQAARDRGVEFEFPYSRENFADRYKRQSRSMPCSTIVAHLSKDGLMFIHPTQNRSITPREAARIQTFPDWFALPESKSASFRLVGNAVPPLVAEAVGLHLKSFLRSASPPTRSAPRHSALSGIARLSPQVMRKVPKTELLQAWRASLSTFRHLHPVNGKEHGTAVEGMRGSALRASKSVDLDGSCFSRTGWPVQLAALSAEVWRRYDKGELTESEIYLDTTRKA